MKANEHPNPADIINQKIVGYIYEPEESDDVILVLDNFLIKVPLAELTIKPRTEAI